MNNETDILLILDLDETLIHATEKELAIPSDFTYAQYSVYKRPYLKEFLTEVAHDFKLAIWSSADDKYVHEIVEIVQPEEIAFEFVWAKSRCTLRRNYELDTYVNEKRLKKVKKQGYTLERALIIDDSPEKTRDNFGNAIYIKAFEGDPNDTELLKLAKYLKTIKHSHNVRTIEKRGWRDQIE